MTDVKMLEDFLAGSHVNATVAALRPDYRTLLTGASTASSAARATRRLKC